MSSRNFSPKVTQRSKVSGNSCQRTDTVMVQALLFANRTQNRKPVTARIYVAYTFHHYEHERAWICNMLSGPSQQTLCGGSVALQSKLLLKKLNYACMLNKQQSTVRKYKLKALTSLCNFLFSTFSSSSTFSAVSDADLYLITWLSKRATWTKEKQEICFIQSHNKAHNISKQSYNNRTWHLWFFYTTKLTTYT